MERKCTRVKNGVTFEVPLFPMDVMNITQGNNGYFSHGGVNALDSAGKDTGKDPIFAPVTMRYVTHDTKQNGNAIWFESVNPVLFADGTINYLTLMFIHDDYIGDVLALAAQGHVFQQGEEVLDEGMAGNSTGNHSHIEGAKGKFQNMYAYNYQTKVYHLPGSIPSDQIFVIDGITLYNDGQPQGGLGNTMYWRKADEIPGIQLAPKVNGSGFSDVPESSYAYKSIKWAHDLGLITGKSGTEFRPLETITRGDLLTILYRLKDQPVVQGNIQFEDVKVTDYFYAPVLWAAENGITIGTGSKFRPKDGTSRLEAVLFLYRLCGSPEPGEYALPFIDVDREDYFAGPIQWAYEKGIVNGKEPNRFDPYGACTREQFIVMLDRTYHRKK